MELELITVEDDIDQAIEEADAVAQEETRRPLKDILHDLSKPVPARLLKSKRMGGSEITFVPWYRAQKILDYYTGGWWHYAIVEKQITETSVWVTVEITIESSDGPVTRQGAGVEQLSVSGFGDPSSNALSMAFRRCLAHFGLGLHLYEGDA